MCRISCVLLLCVYALRVDSTVVDCGSKVGHFRRIEISDCDGSAKNCVLKRRTNATITIEFDVDNDVTGVTAVVHGVIAGVAVPFAIPHPQACDYKNSGLTCPLDKNKGPFTYTETFYIEPSYPKLSLTVRWELKDENKEDIVCINIPAKIQ